MKFLKLVLAGHDTAPSGCFERLAAKLREQGHRVTTFIDHGKPRSHTSEEIVYTVTQSDLVLLGVSSTAESAATELAAGKTAKDRAIPYGFYFDTPLGWTLGRPGSWYYQLADQAKFCCGLPPHDKPAAQQVFPRARFVDTGNPLREEMAWARYTREEVRQALGLEATEQAILFTTLKSPVCNLVQIGILMEALATVQKWRKATDPFEQRILITPHPGDHTSLDLYQEIVAYSPVPARVIGSDVMKGPDLVPGMDLIVEFGSSIGLQAGFHQIPVITLGAEILFQRLKKVTGQRFVELAENGLSVLTKGNSIELALAVKRLLTPEGSESLRQRQRELCPRPAQPGEALSKIANLLIEFAV